MDDDHFEMELPQSVLILMVVGCIALWILFVGEPDIHDAIIQFLMSRTK